MIKFYCDLIKDKYSNSSSNEVTLEDSDGKATGSQMVVIEGKNTTTVSNSTFFYYIVCNELLSYKLMVDFCFRLMLQCLHKLNLIAF